MANGSARAALAVGEAAPPFELPDDAGRLRRSDEWLGRSAGAIVWFTNLCDVCADQARELAAARANGKRHAPLVAVHLPGGNAPSAAAFRRVAGTELPILIDDGSVSRAWTGEAVPDT